MTRVVFMGTPDFAVPPLHALIASANYQVVGVVTQPDRPAGRGQKVQESPVKQVAVAAAIPVLQPDRMKDALSALQAMQPDVIVVAAFGKILRESILNLPPHGCVNVHASLLPRWRGAAPIQAAVRAGDPESGITIMKMDIGLDTGDMIAKRAIPIAADETGESLHDRLAAIGGELLIDALGPYLRGETALQRQDEGLQTYAPMLKKEDGLIDWTQSAESIDRQVRAYHPWPGTFTIWLGQPFKILAPDRGVDLPRTLPGSAEPGVVVSRGRGMVAIGTGDGLYVPYRVQMAGKPAVGISAFVNGHPDFVGMQLGK